MTLNEKRARQFYDELVARGWKPDRALAATRRRFAKLVSADFFQRELA